jgi:chemotaxis protein histidine kinase CheA
MSAKTTPAELRDQVKTLGEKFLLRTSGQILQLRTELERWAAGGDLDALRTFQEIVHKIHGSGAMFGFNLISDLAGNLEELALGFGNRATAPEGASNAARATQMRPVLEQLAEAVTAAATQGAPTT